MSTSTNKTSYRNPNIIIFLDTDIMISRMSAINDQLSSIINDNSIDRIRDDVKSDIEYYTRMLTKDKAMMDKYLQTAAVPVVTRNRYNMLNDDITNTLRHPVIANA